MIGKAFQNQDIAFHFSFYIGIFYPFNIDPAIMVFKCTKTLLIGHIHGYTHLNEFLLPVLLPVYHGFQFLRGVLK